MENLNTIKLSERINKVDLDQQKTIAINSYNLIQKSIKLSKKMKKDFNLLYNHVKSKENFLEYNEKKLKDISVKVNKYYRALDRLDYLYNAFISPVSIFDEITDVEYQGISEEEFKKICIEKYMEQFELIWKMNNEFEILQEIQSVLDEKIR